MKQNAHYTEYLKRRFEERATANPAYSLRAFARDLGITSAKLSEILNRKKGLSETSAKEICKRLGMTKSETEYFCCLVESFDSRAKKKRLLAQKKLENLSTSAQLLQVQEDTFNIISDWYHYAILELVKTKGFKSDPNWIAKRLGISKIQVNQAIDRLTRLEFLEKTNGKIKSLGVHLKTTVGLPSESIRKFHKQVIAKSLEAVSLQTVDERDLGALTIGINTKDLPLIKDFIHSSRKKLGELIAERTKINPPNEVYCYSTQFFKLTKNGELK